MIVRIDVGIILCAPEEIHFEFQLLLVQYYSYQVCQNGSKCLWKICQNGSKCLWIQRQEESVITITLRGISNFYRRSLQRGPRYQKIWIGQQKNAGTRMRDPEAVVLVGLAVVLICLV
jgi:hypothetical protein